MLAFYERLLRVYPSSFRARFGDEMLQLVRDEIAHGRRVGWSRTYADLFGSAIVQRWEAGQMGPRLGYAVIVVLIATAATLVGTGMAISAPGIILFATILAGFGVIVGTGVLLGRRGAEHAYARRGARWWWVPAAILGAGQLVMGAAQLVSDPKATNVFALLVFAVFSALVFGGMAMRNRRAGNYMIAVGVLPVGSVVWWVFPPVLALIVIVMAIADNVRTIRAQPAM